MLLSSNKLKSCWEAILGQFADAVELHSNIITPPDVLDNKNHTVVMIDATAEEVKYLTNWLSTANKSYDIYLYRWDMDNILWLEQVSSLADAIIINTSTNTFSPIKDSIISIFKDAWYYGNNLSVENNQTLSGPEKYFENWDKIK